MWEKRLPNHMEIACSLQKDCDAEDYGIFTVVMYLTKLKTWLLK